MTLTINLPDQKEAALKAKAQAQGVSAEQYVEQMLDHDLENSASTAPIPGTLSEQDSQPARRKHISEVIAEIMKLSKALQPSTLRRYAAKRAIS